MMPIHKTDPVDYVKLKRLRALYHRNKDGRRWDSYYEELSPVECLSLLCEAAENPDEFELRFY